MDAPPPGFEATRPGRAGKAADPPTACARMTSAPPPGGAILAARRRARDRLQARIAAALGPARRARPRDLRPRRSAPRPRDRLESLLRARPPRRRRHRRAVDARDPTLGRDAPREGTALPGEGPHRRPRLARD